MCLSNCSKSHVIVIGGGLAGLCAAIEAANQDSLVTIVEKEKNLGGNSAKATSGINVVNTLIQNNNNISDSIVNFVQDTINSGYGLSNEKLVKKLAHDSQQVIDFLSSFGLELNDIVKLGGHSVARTHRFGPSHDGKPIPVGFTILSSLKNFIKTFKNESITVLLSSSFDSLIWNDGGNVIGIKYIKDGLLNNLYGSVVLASGGFGNDKKEDSLLKEFTPELLHLASTNGPWATGDILKLTRSDNLSLVDMDKVQVHPTGFLDKNNANDASKFLAPESLRGCGAIIIDGKGDRFVNELDRRDVVTNSIFKNGFHFMNDSKNPVVSIMIMNDQVIDKFGSASFNFYKFKKLAFPIGPVENIQQVLNISSSKFIKTINDYSLASDNGRDGFNKTTFPVIFSADDNFYAAYITPSLHYCMGGLKINDEASVFRITNLGKEIIVPGLYAAGEVTGGVHGGNRLGGNSLLECVVFGRTAGYQASKYSSFGNKSEL